jgi:hypothetical protein
MNHTNTTNKKHKDLIEDSLRFCQSNYAGRATWTTLPTILVYYLEDRQLHPRQKHRTQPTSWTTIDTLAGNLIGAWKSAPLFFPNLPFIDLMKDRTFARARNYIEKMAKQCAKKAPAAATPPQIRTAATLALRIGHIQAARFIALCWVTTGRMGCVEKLKAENLSWSRAQIPGQAPRTALAVQFLEGKGVQIRGPYTVHTSMGKFAPILTPLVGTTGQMFMDKDRTIAQACLRAVNITLEARSLRRGSLQAMADKGASDEVLMHFSGHTRRSTLYRYLGWGLKRAQAAWLATEAAQALHE